MATAPLWELALLHAHYHPHLAAAARTLVTGGQGAPVLGGAHSPEEAAVAYDTSEGRFRPPPQPPRAGGKHAGPVKAEGADEVAARLEALDGAEEPLDVDDAFRWHFRCVAVLVLGICRRRAQDVEAVRGAPRTAEGIRGAVQKCGEDEGKMCTVLTV